jgi:fatty acid desaturase
MPKEKESESCPHKAKLSVKGTVELKIGLLDRSIDVTQFADEHPGGREVLEIMKNADATSEFLAIHSQKTVSKFMKKGTPLARKSGLESQTRSTLESDYIQLYRQFQAEGRFSKQPLREIASGITQLALFAATVWLPPAWWPLAILLFAIFLVRCGWLTHDNCHEKGPLAKTLAYLYGPFLGGTSITWWSRKHNIHHLFTNHEQHDDDIRQEPLLSLHPKPPQSGRPDGLRHFQHYYYLFLFALLGFAWRLISLIDTFRPGFREKNYVEASLLVIHYPIMFAIIDWPVFLLANIFGGFWVMLVVSTNHQSEPITPATEERVPFVRNQIETTRNFSLGILRPLRPLFGGMEFQIEHHLFPTMGRQHYALISQDIRTLCEKHGLDYKTATFPHIVKRTFDTYERAAGS